MLLLSHGFSASCYTLEKLIDELYSYWTLERSSSVRQACRYVIIYETSNTALAHRSLQELSFYKYVLPGHILCGFKLNDVHLEVLRPTADGLL